ncbi:N-acylglucosamine 2-epimerase [Alginatibacterium sediminis]|uniref:Cellobiose 2-epimerase n=1 Tax=Alginatibacterium sediminis TaxID=2164068 RepID=A0A420E8C4_9ALTE|nr:AGE family epimerase/isomerase [Alginatibacterium sediminis]RKF15568.1 N-acylglucosamine 2-epimerase [Alginatibacterium sediminis]
MSLQSMQHALSNELEHNILSYWLKHLDHEGGGFHSYADHNGTIQADFNKGVLLHSRILWTFSAAYRTFPKPEYLQAAKQAFDFLAGAAWDAEFGGVYWMLDSQCNVIDSQKHVYNQGFAIYAFSEYYLASNDPKALVLSEQLFDLIEQHAADQEFGGYLEAFDCQWEPIANSLVCDTQEDVLAEKSMNTHLHILEAYANLQRAKPQVKVESRLIHLLELFEEHIIDDKCHYGLFFQRDWQCVSQDVSYGHDIEGTWLLDDAALQVNQPTLRKRIQDSSLEMAYATLNEGRDFDGAVFNELHQQRYLDCDRIWWVQAEAMLGFYNAFEKSLDPKMLEASQHCWDIIQTQLIDHTHGEWHMQTNRFGKPYTDLPKVEPWKCPYHNGRACLEMYLRLEKLQN